MELRKELERLNGLELDLDGKVVAIKDLAPRINVSERALKIFLEKNVPEGYVFTGNVLLDKAIIEDRANKLKELREREGTYREALLLLEEKVPKEFCAEVFNSLGFKVNWDSLDVENSPIR